MENPLQREKSMRQIVLDTETTGLNARSGDRIVEIGCVEIINRKLTKNNFHYHLNPERDSDEGALAVHGLSAEFLSSQPKFAEIADAFCDYVSGADIIIHNAPFDIGFLDAELQRLNRPPFQKHVGEIIDTLKQAKEIHPGKRNSLDALCERYGVSNAHRTLHGAALDAELLAHVYLRMTRGQDSLMMALEAAAIDVDKAWETSMIADIIVHGASTQELVAHEALLDDIGRQNQAEALWRTDVKKAGRNVVNK